VAEGPRAAAAALRRPSFAGKVFGRDDSRSYGALAPAPFDNRLVHGDNVDALAWLEASHAGRFRCVYLDPPYNTGRRFAEYDDRDSPEAWRTKIRAQLAAIAPLVAVDGAVVAQIDDTELAQLQLAMDDVFGRENRISTITVVRSASTGHKAKNPGPVNVTDFLLLYAKDRTRFRATPQVRERARYDAAYATFIEGREGDPHAWRFVPLARAAAHHLGHASAKDASRVLGADVFRARTARFALDHAAAVVRFAQPRFEAVSRAAQEAILRSRERPEEVVVLERGATLPPLLLRGGNRILFLASKVREIDGRRVLVEPLTNVWDDVPFQGIAREGGVAFVRNKKPERLLQRILAMTTDPGDWVLDPFAGSGTTAAVAHKMGRSWVAIERGDHVNSLCIPRLQRVVDGTDVTGVTRACHYEGGGGFAVYA
jgi:adenine-specific DNA-methyltransferase